MILKKKKEKNNKTKMRFYFSKLLYLLGLSKSVHKLVVGPKLVFNQDREEDVSTMAQGQSTHLHLYV